MQYGDLVAFILYIYMIFRPIRQLADRFNTLQMGMVASERVFKVMDTEAQITGSGKNLKPSIDGTISFKNVWFAYNDEDWVLSDDVSFCREQPWTKAHCDCGRNGCRAKQASSTLLSRFYEFNKGSNRD